MNAPQKIDVPFEYQIWTGEQCAAYLGHSYSNFIRRTQYVEGFPKRCPVPGQPRWSAKAVADWALGESQTSPPDSRQSEVSA